MKPKSAGFALALRCATPHCGASMRTNGSKVIGGNLRHDADCPETKELEEVLKLVGTSIVH